MKRIGQEERPGINNQGAPLSDSDQGSIETDGTSQPKSVRPADVPYPLDERGLHPDDSGRIFAVRVVHEYGAKAKKRETRRSWFKTPSAARNYANHQNLEGRYAQIEEYDLSNRRVIEMTEPDTRVTGGSDG